MTSPTVREAPVAGRRSLWAELRAGGSVRGYIASLAIGVMLAFGGAFNSGDAPLWTRLAYWPTLMVIGALIGTLVSWQLIRLERLVRSPFLAWVVVTVAVGLPMTVVVWAITGLLFLDSRLEVAILHWYLPPVMLLSGLMAGLSILLNQAPPETRAAAPDDGPPRFLSRLPHGLKGALIHAVEADDHYLKVHTSRGMDMILMRLSDAVDELEGIAGAQVHRSWWVARAAVEAVDRADGRITLVVASGLRVPVSRTFVKALREEGWI
jgi:hypothetical protein